MNSGGRGRFFVLDDGEIGDATDLLCPGVRDTPAPGEEVEVVDVLTLRSPSWGSGLVGFEDLRRLDWPEAGMMPT